MTMTNDCYAGYCACGCRNILSEFTHEKNYDITHKEEISCTEKKLNKKLLMEKKYAHHKMNGLLKKNVALPKTTNGQSIQDGPLHTSHQFIYDYGLTLFICICSSDIRSFGCFFPWFSLKHFCIGHQIF